jgi:hypothetical protein
MARSSAVWPCTTAQYDRLLVSQYPPRIGVLYRSDPWSYFRLPPTLSARSPPNV